MKQLQQLQQALIDAGLVAHRDDDNIMLVGHGSRSITREDILKALHGPEQLHNLSLTEKDGIVIIYRRNAGRKNRRGPVPLANQDKMFRLQVGPALDDESQVTREWWEGYSPEARMMHLNFRRQDWESDQQIALERSAGNG